MQKLSAIINQAQTYTHSQNCNIGDIEQYNFIVRTETFWLIRRTFETGANYKWIINNNKHFLYLDLQKLKTEFAPKIVPIL